MSLSEASCEPCRSDMPALTDEAIAPLMAQVPKWQVVNVEGVRRLRRDILFPGFRGAMGFAVQVALLAESVGHHPDLHVSWGRVGLEVWTHKIGGLHANDFVLAAKIDKLPGA